MTRLEHYRVLHERLAALRPGTSGTYDFPRHERTVVMQAVNHAAHNALGPGMYRTVTSDNSIVIERLTERRLGYKRRPEAFIGGIVAEWNTIQGEYRAWLGE